MTRMSELRLKYKASGIEMPTVNYTVKHKSQYIGHWNVELNTSVGMFYEVIHKSERVEEAKLQFYRRYLEQVRLDERDPK